jgi:hypothetical protein
MSQPKTKLAVARMVAGLRHALCKKESQESANNHRFQVFQKEEDSRWSNGRGETPEERLLRAGKNNRSQIRNSMGSTLSFHLKKQGVERPAKANETARKLLGCPIAHFFLHLENQFSEGMGWHNYGKWHIDHIIPCTAFDFSIESHIQECFHFSNMQPLWARENIAKGNRIYAAISTEN